MKTAIPNLSRFAILQAKLKAKVAEKRKALKANPSLRSGAAEKNLYYLDHSATLEELLALFYRTNRRPEPLGNKIYRSPDQFSFPTYRDVAYCNHFVVRVFKSDTGLHEARLYYISYEVKLQSWVSSFKIEAEFYNRTQVLAKLRLAIVAKKFQMTNYTKDIRVWK